jgi:hypothetical protein
MKSEEGAMCEVKEIKKVLNDYGYSPNLEVV